MPAHAPDLHASQLPDPPPPAQLHPIRRRPGAAAALPPLNITKTDAITPASTAASREPNKYQATRVTSPPVAADPISRPSVARIRPPSNSTGMIRNGLSGSMLNDPGLCQCGGSGARSCSPSIIRLIPLTPAVMPPAQSPALKFGVIASSIMRLVVASVLLPSRPDPTSRHR